MFSVWCLAEDQIGAWIKLCRIWTGLRERVNWMRCIDLGLCIPLNFPILRPSYESRAALAKTRMTAQRQGKRRLSALRQPIRAQRAHEWNSPSHGTVHQRADPRQTRQAAHQEMDQLWNGFSDTTQHVMAVAQSCPFRNQGVNRRRMSDVPKIATPCISPADALPPWTD